VGVTGLINFCHGDFVMIGAFITYYLFTAGVNIYLCMLISFLSIGLLAYISFELFLGRILTTVTRNQILGTLRPRASPAKRRDADFQSVVRSMQATLLPLVQAGNHYYSGNYAFIALYGFALYAGLILLIYRTRFGLTMRLTSDNRELAMFTGVDTRRAYRSAFVVGGALAGAAGTLVAVLLYVYPSVGAEFTSKALAIVIMGGLGSIPAPCSAPPFWRLWKGSCRRLSPTRKLGLRRFLRPADRHAGGPSERILREAG
jgi:branched-chain amino acid transport system permease protein